MLKQAILVRQDIKVSQNTLLKCIAKAPMKLMTRCFDGATGFMGRHEANEFQKVVIDWIDNHDQETDVYKADDMSFLDTYMWTAEMEGIPTEYVTDKSGEIICVVMGPSESDTLANVLVGAEFA